MLVEFQDVVALDITFEDVLLDEVSFEDSTAFTVDFDDFSLHPTKHYLQASIVPTIIGSDNLTGINSESASVVALVQITDGLTRVADLPEASVAALASASGELVRIKPLEPAQAAIEAVVEESMTRILDGQRRRIRARVYASGKLSLKGPLHSTAIIYTYASGNLNSVTPLEPAEAGALTSVTGALTRIISLEPAAAEIPASISADLVRLKFLEPKAAIPEISIAGTMVRTKFLEPASASALVAISGTLKSYQTMRGDDDAYLAGDDAEQLGDTF